MLLLELNDDFFILDRIFNHHSRIFAPLTFDSISEIETLEKKRRKETKTYQNSNNKNSLIFLVKIQNAERSTCWNISILEGTRYQIIRFLNEALIFTSMSSKIFFFLERFWEQKKNQKTKNFPIIPTLQKTVAIPIILKICNYHNKLSIFDFMRWSNVYFETMI